MQGVTLKIGVVQEFGKIGWRARWGSTRGFMPMSILRILKYLRPHTVQQLCERAMIEIKQIEYSSGYVRVWPRSKIRATVAAVFARNFQQEKTCQGSTP